MTRFVLALLLILGAIQAAKINILTSIIVNQVPFSQTLTCSDCVPPVVYSANGLPSFMTLDQNVLKVEGRPQPGQYHLTITMTDANQQTAEILVILVILDELSPNNWQNFSSSNTTISLYSTQDQTNLTTLLLQSNPELSADELRIQQALKKQADVNNQVGQLLILIQRYSNVQLQNQRQQAQLSAELQALLPEQTRINTQIGRIQNQLRINKAAINQLLQSITQMTNLAAQKRSQRNDLLRRVNSLRNQVEMKLVDKATLESTLTIRQQELAAMNNSTQNSNCKNASIDYQENLLRQSNVNRTVMEVNVRNIDRNISTIDNRIQTLKDQLAAAENEKDMALMKKYQFQAKLTQLNTQIASSQTLLQSLRAQCQITEVSGPGSVEHLRQLIQETQNQINGIENYLNQTLYVQIAEANQGANDLQNDLGFINNAIDASLNEISRLYRQNEGLEERLGELQQEKKTTDTQISVLSTRLDGLLQNKRASTQILEVFREDLQTALEKKQEADFQLQQIFLQNLDIVKSVNGEGTYSFDIQRLSNITGIDRSSFIAQQLFQLNLPTNSALDCNTTIQYYGIGRISSVNQNQGSIIINNGRANLILNFPSCSVNLATRNNYFPQDGDAICWKGFRDSGKWVILESIIFPSN